MGVHCTLNTLVLFGTRMGDGAARALVEAVAHNSTLSTLVFYGKALTGRGIGDFERMLRSNVVGSLAEFVVGGTSFGDEDAQALMQAAVYRSQNLRLRALRKFGLLSTLLGDASVCTMQELMRAGFSQLTIMAGRLTDSALVDIVNAWGHLGNDVPAFVCLASAAAGNLSLSTAEGHFSKGVGFGTLELVLGGASDERTNEVLRKTCGQVWNTIREPADLWWRAAFECASQNNGNDLATTEEEEVLNWQPAPVAASALRLYTTNKFSQYMEEVLFPRLFLRYRTVSK